MRMLLRVSIPVEAGNAAMKAGTLGSTMERILADLKPEAAYFFADDNGNRSGSIVFDLQDPSQIPAVAEPWFIAFNAKVSLRPVMTPQDLGAAMPSIAKVVEHTGSRHLLEVLIELRKTSWVGHLRGDRADKPPCRRGRCASPVPQ
jgi:hypothetical protein